MAFQDGGVDSGEVHTSHLDRDVDFVHSRHGQHPVCNVSRQLDLA